MSLKNSMPVLARHEGVWDGYYRYYNNQGIKVDEHKSRLLCRLIDNKDYHQTNLYRWEDGKSDFRDFPAEIINNRLIFNTDIDGWCAEVDLDEYKRTMFLYWKRKNEPNTYLYEMIQMSDDGLTRARTWQWFKNDRLFQRTLIDETRVSLDWLAYEGVDPLYDEITV